MDHSALPPSRIPHAQKMGTRITDRLPADASGIARAAALLQAGEIVAFPTETVYGLGADARRSDAVAKIFAAKDRPSFNPLIVHVRDKAHAQEFVVWSAMAERLAQSFWPGALSMVLPLRPDAGISPLVTAGLDTLAVRVPKGAVAEALLDAAGCPVAAPSANPSGQISATTADHVLAGLTGKIGAVLDGGSCVVGLESTIVSIAEHGSPRLLRPGGVATEDISALLGSVPSGPQAGAGITAPGQLSSHYAPHAPLRLNAQAARGTELLIGFGPVLGEMSLSRDGDVIEAAQNLFPMLHQADATGRPIAVAPVPETGLGIAINDRLVRAAAPR